MPRFSSPAATACTISPAQHLALGPLLPADAVALLVAADRAGTVRVFAWRDVQERWERTAYRRNSYESP